MFNGLLFTGIEYHLLELLLKWLKFNCYDNGECMDLFFNYNCTVNCKWSIFSIADM